MISCVNNNEGECLKVAGSSYRILIDGKQTNGMYSVIEMQIPPGSGPIPHSHKDIQETFFVVEGEIEFRCVGKKSIAAQGTFVNIPFGGAVHAFKNTSNQIVKLIVTVMPAGLEDMFREVSISGSENAVEIGKRYGNVFYPMDYLDE